MERRAQPSIVRDGAVQTRGEGQRWIHCWGAYVWQSHLRNRKGPTLRYNSLYALKRAWSPRQVGICKAFIVWTHEPTYPSKKQ